MLLELIAASVVLAFFTEDWTLKLVGIPALMAAYASMRFAMSARARVIQDIECDGSWRWLYLLVFGYNFLIAAVCTGVTGLITETL